MSSVKYRLEGYLKSPTIWIVQMYWDDPLCLLGFSRPLLSSVDF